MLLKEKQEAVGTSLSAPVTALRCTCCHNALQKLWSVRNFVEKWNFPKALSEIQNYVNASYKQLFHWDQCEKVNPACEYHHQEAEPAGWLSCHATFEAACSDVMRCARSRSSAHTVFFYLCACSSPHYSQTYFRYSTRGYFQVVCKIGNG